jgi:hypothetical protein
MRLIDPEIPRPEGSAEVKGRHGVTISGPVPAVAGGDGPVSLAGAAGLSEAEIAGAEWVLAAMQDDPAAGGGR